MRLARGPRPWAVRLFALAFIAQGLSAFGLAMANLEETRAMLATYAPGTAIGEDFAIVVVSARLTIALIPVALVWVFASRVARWLVLALAIGKAVMLPVNLGWLAPGELPAPAWIAEQVLTWVAAALLFTPGAARWLRSGGRMRADARLSNPL